jgi:hypothetical protein
METVFSVGSDPRPAEIELSSSLRRQSKIIEKRRRRVQLRVESQPVKRIIYV